MTKHGLHFIKHQYAWLLSLCISEGKAQPTLRLPYLNNIIIVRV